MEEIILKYLENKLSQAEEVQLRDWLEENALNRQVFENLVSQWKLSEQQIEQSKQNVWKRVMTEGSRKEKPTFAFWKIIYRVAAILILTFGLIYMVMMNDHWNGDHQQVQSVFIEKEASFGLKLTFELPDGSIVKLNSGSKLIYPQVFAAHSRQVQLIGEAFFDVARDSQRPFEIESGELKVAVIGTSFNVKSYPDDDHLSVAVRTGKVAVSSDLNQEQVLLAPAQSFHYDRQEKSFEQKSVEDDEIVFGWMEQTLIFKDQPLDEILKLVSRWYDVKVEVSETVNQKREFTAKYKNPTLRSVLESLSYAYEFEFEINETGVMIT